MSGALCSLCSSVATVVSSPFLGRHCAALSTFCALCYVTEMPEIRLLFRSFVHFVFTFQAGLDEDDARLIEERGGGRSTMHVQSISHWAPANIGPYSQAVKVGNVAEGICGHGRKEGRKGLLAQAWHGMIYPSH